jgi:hypothetical protein
MRALAHSMTLVALFRSVRTSEVSGSSGRIAACPAKLAEKKVPASLADCFAHCAVESHDKALS